MAAKCYIFIQKMLSLVTSLLLFDLVSCPKCLYFTDAMFSKKGSKRARLRITETCQGKSVAHQALLQYPATCSTEAASNLPTVHELQEHEVQQEQPAPSSTEEPSFQHVHEPSNADWAAIQQQFVDAYFELVAVRKCTFCDTIIADNSEHIKCGDCGTQTYFCSQKCFRKVHNAHCNPFHKAQEWLVSNFQLIYTSYIFFRRSTFKESTKC